mgnify:CR=1 FL=1
MAEPPLQELLADQFTHRAYGYRRRDRTIGPAEPDNPVLEFTETESDGRTVCYWSDGTQTEHSSFFNIWKDVMHG